MTVHVAESLSPTFIWDFPTRLFHWVLTAAVGAALYSGFLAPESWLGIHRAAGYVVTALIIFRLVWWRYGFVYSRLSTLLAAIGKLPSFLPALLRLKPPHVAGHNPAGSVMIIGLIVVLSATSITGFIAEGGYEKLGILAGITSFALGSLAREIHELLAWLILFMAAGHIAGVTLESFVLKISLVRGMITGFLPVPRGVALSSPQQSRPVMAIAVLGAIGLISAFGLTRLLQIPPHGIPLLESNKSFAEECSSCHMLFHPSLLPRASWAAMMSGLKDHFGEDASLDDKAAAAIATYLDKYASEASDSEAANLLRRTSAQHPLQITESPYWVRKHSHIAPAIFVSAPVKSKSNCIACHSDAVTGRFDDQVIAVPGPQKEGT